MHAVMACGVLDAQRQWATPVRKPDFLFPVHALSKVFRGKFMAALTAAHRNAQIEHDPQGQDAQWRERQRALYRHDWVVYAKTPLGGPAQVLEYLSRYTHRTAIGNQRIRDISTDQVAFTVRANDRGAKRLIRLAGTEFIRRFLLHVLPTGINRIRHYGVLAAACKTLKLEQARQALQLPTANPQAIESARQFMARVALIDVLLCPLCPLCHVGRLHVVQVLPGQKQLPAPQCTVACTEPPNRGPP